MVQKHDTKKTKLWQTGSAIWSHRYSIGLVSLYLAAIVIANLLSAKYGPSISILNAFLFIGLDLSSRDKLHEAWQRKGLVWKMGMLIVAGSGLTFLLNRDAGPIAKASLLAFAAASTVDALFYYWLRERSYLIKVNGSNVFGAAVDSIVFPWQAFGGFLPWVTLGQFAAKVIGGALWSWVLMNKSKRQDILCRFDWHKYPLDWIDMIHEQCPHCKKVWESNPYWL